MNMQCSYTMLSACMWYFKDSSLKKIFFKNLINFALLNTKIKKNKEEIITLLANKVEFTTEKISLDIIHRQYNLAAMFILKTEFKVFFRKGECQVLHRMQKLRYIRHKLKTSRKKEL